LPGRRRAEPDPPGEDRAGLLGHADQHGARDADDGAGPRRSRDPPRRRPRAGALPLEPAGSTHRHPRALGLRREERSRHDPCGRPASRAAADTRVAHGRRLTVSDSIWKKEISLKRKSKPDNDPDFDLEPPKRSFLKKEISFSRKPKEPKAQKQSFL